MPAANAFALQAGSPDDLANCQPQDCGQNGPWAGQGNKFRSLHLPEGGIPHGTGAENNHHIRITHFQTKQHEPLTMGLDGDRLLGFLSGSKSPLSDAELEGAEITLEGPTPECDVAIQRTGSNDCTRRPVTYTLTLTGIGSSPFWTNCAGDDQRKECQAAPQSTPVYAFLVTSSAGGCAPLCDPNINVSDQGLAGTAVIFGGDSYDETASGMKVRSIDGKKPDDNLKPEDNDLFNIACYGTAVSKLHLLRHTAASMGSAPEHTTVPQRQTMLQLLAGDYCGNGHFFTNNGHPLGLDFDSKLWRPIDPVGIASAGSIDAMWSGDGSGASCIGVPRLSDSQKTEDVLKQIQGSCPKKHFGVCPMNWLDKVKQTHDLAGNYAISTNEFGSSVLPP